MDTTSASYSGDQGFISQAGNRLLLLVCWPFTYFCRNIPAQHDKWGTIASSHIFSNSLFSVHPTLDAICAKWDQSIVYPLLYVNCLSTVIRQTSRSSPKLTSRWLYCHMSIKYQLSDENDNGGLVPWPSFKVTDWCHLSSPVRKALSSHPAHLPEPGVGVTPLNLTHGVATSVRYVALMADEPTAPQQTATTAIFARQNSKKRLQTRMLLD
jgi:hypothetical protein